MVISYPNFVCGYCVDAARFLRKLYGADTEETRRKHGGTTQEGGAWKGGLILNLVDSFFLFLI